MQIDSDGEEEIQIRTEGEKDRAKDNNQVKRSIYKFITHKIILLYSCL